MSILTMLPGAEWYEPADLIEVEPDPTPDAHEALTVTAGLVYWTASAFLEDDE